MGLGGFTTSQQEVDVFTVSQQIEAAETFYQTSMDDGDEPPSDEDISDSWCDDYCRCQCDHSYGRCEMEADNYARLSNQYADEVAAERSLDARFEAWLRQARFNICQDWVAVEAERIRQQWDAEFAARPQMSV